MLKFEEPPHSVKEAPSMVGVGGGRERRTMILLVNISSPRLLVHGDVTED